MKYQPGRKVDPDLLTGHVVCAVCEQSVNVKKSSPRGIPVYHYACSNASRGKANQAAGRFKCPNNRYHNMERLEQKCWAALVHHLTDPDLLAQLFEEHAEAPPNHTDEIKQKEDQLVGLYGLLTEPGRVTSAVKRKIEAVEDELALLQQAPPPSPTPNVDLVRFAEQLKPHLASTGKHARRELMTALRVRFFINREGLERLEITVPRA
ncbi:zinc ribbon domain-containing protein [Deinococcus malanensis]|uniref:zinc ribbon domain-containing protein n=1 Tax=Deinococcus malanensis TaxID=1706855 RepID=UPI00363BEE2D